MALICRICNTERPEEDFQASALARGYNRCKPCAAAYYRANRERDPDKLLDQNLRRKYGITAEDFHAMNKSQDGRCAICAAKPPEGRRLYVDHCHATGVVRGLLCKMCNLILGQFQDDPALFDSAAEYLRNSHTIG